MGKSSYHWGHNGRNIILASGCIILASGCMILASGCIILASGCMILAPGCMILASATVRDIVGRLNIDG